MSTDSRSVVRIDNNVVYIDDGRAAGAAAVAVAVAAESKERESRESE